MSRRVATAMLVLVSISAVAAPAAAKQLRLALVIGNNHGQPDETPLLYAERDAERVADVMVRLAGVSEENLLLLRGADAARVQKVIADVGRRIEQQRAKGPVEAMLVVYFSGHASVGALHLGASELTFVRLKQLIKAAGADVSVFVIDACRSGGLTRVKGAAPAAPFQIEVEDQLQSKGTAIITSSSAGEDAQESDRLGGGIFTHHFINGLRGAADDSADQRVTIGEAYRYAYAQTLRATSRTRFVQHPTYAFRIKGKHELTLTRIDQAAGQGRLHLEEGGLYVILDRTRGGAVLAELRAKKGTDVLLPQGKYLVRLRGRRSVREAKIAIGRGQRVSLATATMTKVPYGKTVRRGLSKRSVISVDAATIASTPVLAGQSNALYGSLGAGLETKGARLLLRLRYGAADATNSDLQLQQGMLGADLGIVRIFDIPRTNLGLGVGLRAGGDWIMQRFTTLGVAPDRDQWAWRLSPSARLEWAPMPRWTVGVECGVDVYALQMQRDRQPVWENPVVPFCAAGISAYLP